MSTRQILSRWWVRGRIHQAAGPKLLQARQKIGPIPVGQAALTRGYALPGKYVIHTVGPVWQGGGQQEEEKLRSCYENSLALAVKKGCKSIAFPLIATGHYGFPKDLALGIAMAVFSSFLETRDMDIFLVVFDETSYKLSENLFQNVRSYIDAHYVEAVEKTWTTRRQREERSMPAPCMAEAKCLCLEDMLRQEDAGFSETLLRLIDERGKKDSQVYKKANLSKQHFSKIRKDPAYRPKKTTALALAIALELDVEQTRDLIGRAGYALTNSSKFDLIVRYFIEKKDYDVVKINMALYEFDQMLLGS